MIQVRTNAELQAIHSQGEGFIFNHFTSGPTAAQNNLLHAASCTQVKRMLGSGDPGCQPSVRKNYFETVDDAQAWLAQHLGLEGVGWKRCSTCRPGSPVVTEGLLHARRRDALATNPPGANRPFREAKVEQLLYIYLREAGYRVQEKVPVPSGIVDAIAIRDGERIVIEAKGEDKGGYGSAQMNFQMALGQIASRMTDPHTTYAIAFPMTGDYVKVLRTFRGSLAFERLNLVFYLVEQNGEVRAIKADLIPAWIESLVAP